MPAGLGAINDGMTHLGRALDKLGDEIICANSPKAKGRVERVNGKLQDRLVKAMRLTVISSINEANTFLPSYLIRHNARFACAPADPRDVPARSQRMRMLRRRWCGGGADRYRLTGAALQRGHVYSRVDALNRSLARKRVHVCEYPDGRIEIRTARAVLLYRVFDKMRQVNQAAIVGTSNGAPRYNGSDHPGRCPASFQAQKQRARM